jgi:hypothetical protein
VQQQQQQQQQQQGQRSALPPLILGGAHGAPPAPANDAAAALLAQLLAYCPVAWPACSGPAALATCALARDMLCRAAAAADAAPTSLDFEIWMTGPAAGSVVRREWQRQRQVAGKAGGSAASGAAGTGPIPSLKSLIGADVILEIRLGDKAGAMFVALSPAKLVEGARGLRCPRTPTALARSRSCAGCVLCNPSPGGASAGLPAGGKLPATPSAPLLPKVPEASP